MATTEELYKTNSATTPTTPATTATAPATTTTSAQAAYAGGGNPDVTSLSGIANTNQQREDTINKMYDASLEGRNASLKSAYDINLGNAQADKEKIGEQYQTQRNTAAANYERASRNNNLAFAANGLNTGAGSQARLAQSNVYQSNIGQLNKAEAAANTEADRNISNIMGAYQADIVQAKADNDTQRMAALLDESQQAYNRIESSAKLLAASGDFSGYEILFGEERADNMKKAWIAENPDTAYRTGAISADEYLRLTGKYPAGYNAGGGGGGGTPGSGGDTAYRGPAGAYVNGVFTVGASPSSSGSSSSSSRSSSSASTSGHPRMGMTLGQIVNGK